MSEGAPPGAGPPPPPATRQGPPARPRDDRALGFTRRGPVRWFQPKILLSTGQRVVLSAAVGDFLDKRELQQALPHAVLAHGADGEEGWFDYVADTGDGFDATYAVAWLTGQPTLDVAGDDTVPAPPAPLPRGGLLVLGGDEVYPVGASDAYDDRFRGPYKAALPYVDETVARLEVVALPGNHDWYDGLTNFMRVFCAGDDHWVGARQTRQSRSYFAVALAHGWWLWGIDIQFDAFIDEPQLRYFTAAAAQMGEGANLILCTAKPSWTDLARDPGAFRNLAFLEDRVIRPAGIHLRVSLSGDSHHYAHYVSEDGAHKITAGGGGAFLHPTHHLAPRIQVPTDPAARHHRRYDLQACYPSRRTSRRLSAGALLLPRTNPEFMLVPAVLYVLLGWASQFGNRVLSAGGRDTFEANLQSYGWLDHLLGLGRNSGSMVLLVLLLGALIGFAKPPDRWAQGPRRTVARTVMGATHFATHLAVGAAAGSVAIDLASFADGRWFTVAVILALALVGALASSLVMGLYLAVWCAFFHAHGNEAFSSMGLSRYKNFLRCHVDADGVLTIYPIGVDRVPHRWRFDHTAAPEAPWLAPDGEPPRAHLVDRPIRVDPRSTNAD